MEAAGVVTFLVLVFAFAASALALGRLDVTAPMAFVVAGALLSLALPDVEGAAAEGLTALTELTLALILFHDAAQVRPRQISADRGLVLRLLLVGLPLTVAAGWLLGSALFPATSGMMLLLLAASVAPTDAGLGAATVLNPVVPARVRRVLNVESGLNDGLVTPVVLFALAALADEQGLGPPEGIGAALVDLAVGVVVGAAVGAGAGILLGLSRRRGASTLHSRPLAVLVLPVLAFSGAELAGGNTFVAAFVAGSAFAGAAPWLDEEEGTLGLTEAVADPLGFAVWLAFGFLAVPVLIDHVGAAEVVFALLALTALRMLPVALVLLGTGLHPRTVAFIGWFGPRGLASVVFTLLALEALPLDPQLTTVVATICLTVVLSVLAHGLTADPLARRYGAWVARERPTQETGPSAQPRRPRSLQHRGSDPPQE